MHVEIQHHELPTLEFIVNSVILLFTSKLDLGQTLGH